MSTWTAKVTDKGNALLAKLTQGVSLEITSAKTGTGTVDVSLLQKQTNVTSPKQTVEIQPVGYPETGKIGLPITVSNQGLTASYTFWQIGVYANDPDEGEILFFIAQAEDKGTDMLSQTMVASYKSEFVFYVEFDQADSVTVTVDPANSVTQTGMENYVSTEIKAAKAYVDAQVTEAKNYVDTETQAATASKAEKTLSNVDASNVKAKLDAAEIVTTAGTGAAYTATVPGITALTAGVSFTMIPHTASTTTQPTLNVNGLGAKNLRQPLTTNTGATTTADLDTWLSSGKPVRVRYDGTLWETDIPRPSASNLYGSVPIEHGGHGGETLAEAQANLGIITLEELPNLYIWKKYTGEPDTYSEEECANATIHASVFTVSSPYYTKTVNCSAEITVENGAVSLVSPTVVEATGEKVCGKYISVGNTVYYIPEDAVVTTTQKSDGKTITTASVAIKIVPSGFLGYVPSKASNTYPTNGEHTDGYWYLYHKQLGE